VVAVNVVIPPLQSNTQPSPSGAVEAATAFAPYVVTPAPTETPTGTPSAAVEPSDYAAASTEPEPSPTQTVLVSSTPSPTPRPQRTPAPPPPVVVTPAPTQAPTQKPTATPTKKPKPTPKPKAPTVSFTADTSSLPVEGGTVQFTITAANGETYFIDFDDAGQTDSGSIASGAAVVSHTYNGAPPFHVAVTVTGPGGSTPDSLIINVQ
jgi:outer membrane biosynthesis protein TonB